MRRIREHNLYRIFQSDPGEFHAPIEGDRHLERRPAGTSRCYETPQHPPRVSIRHLCALSEPARSGCCEYALLVAMWEVPR
jgi:hypothetical protein